MWSVGIPPKKGKDNGKYDGHGDGIEKDQEDEECNDDKKDKGAKKSKPSKGYLTQQNSPMVFLADNTKENFTTVVREILQFLRNRFRILYK